MSGASGGRSLRVAGLFAGVGGIEIGLARAGHHSELLCEVDPWPAAVLAERFDGVPLHSDVSTLPSLPSIDLLAGGFPCQDISLAGTRAGLDGERSGLVSHLFRLVASAKPEFVLLENVSNLLRLSSGQVMRAVIAELEGLGYRWAYRLVDTRGFGLPQRRQRVLILGSRGDVAPQDVLLAASVPNTSDDSIVEPEPGRCYGFYWTEGRRGVGWAQDAVPTIKGGSGLGIPSPPAIFDADCRRAGTPHIEDGERLQGFDAGWTSVSIDGVAAKEGTRWKMVGNAVSVPVAEWVGTELAHDVEPADLQEVRMPRSGAVPKAAFGGPGRTWTAVAVSTHVERGHHMPIGAFLQHPLKPLSERALRGYISRAETGTKRLPDGFLRGLRTQLLLHEPRSIESPSIAVA